MRTIAFSEIEAYACSNLVAKMEKGFLDAAPIWTNLKTFPWSNFRGKVDILSGGYPCQPFSAAGKRLGKDDPRHLWPYIADGVRLMQPRLCFFENVEGHISLGLREVIEELESIGYQTTWGIFSASEVGATHRRKRMFILAHTKSCKPWKSSEWQGGQDTRGGSKEDVAHTNSGGFTSEQHTRGSTEENSRRESDTQSSNTNVAQPNSLEARQGFQDRTRNKKGTQESLTTVVINGLAVQKNHNTIGNPQESWATPQARDGQGGTNVGLWLDLKRSRALPNQMCFVNNKDNVKLNPRWVETLMGIPIGWTMPSCTNPLIIEQTNSGYLAMGLSQQLPH